jgi:transcriptional regulator with GAF, ATPase, and Fis domain
VVLRDRTHEVQLEEAASNRMHLGGLVGNSAVMQELFSQILRAAASEASILITGESGTGKELVARALHDNSSRAKGPYIRVHCAAFPEQLLEGELFGHARGAFTGATVAREGRFEAAHGGTLLLDEIGEVPLSVQVKLLRVLQEREIERLGENQSRKVDVRIIAATHRDLPAMVSRGEFRADLYYRLRVLPLHVPALRERKEDIPLLVNSMLASILSRHQGRDIQISGEALGALSAYGWPGNVRELGNALEYAVVQADGATIFRRPWKPWRRRWCSAITVHQYCRKGARRRSSSLR